jgi:hypothetical protein
MFMDDLGNGLSAGQLSLKDFHALLQLDPKSSRHIQVENILVVDHLGRNIPVPTMFCSTWKVDILCLLHMGQLACIGTPGF